MGHKSTCIGMYLLFRKPVQRTICPLHYSIPSESLCPYQSIRTLDGWCLYALLPNLSRSVFEYIFPDTKTSPPNIPSIGMSFFFVNIAPCTP
jgi:hypothetical protein